MTTANAKKVSGKPILEYSIKPDEVYISLPASLMLIIENPINNLPVIFKGGRQGDEIDITFPAPPAHPGAGALTDKIDFSGRSQTDGFTVGRAASGNYFAVKPVGSGRELSPGEAIRIKFNPVTINPTTGNPKVKIDEFIGSNQASTKVEISKVPCELSISAWLDPYIVGLKQQSTLYWLSFGGTSVEVAGFADGTGSRDFPVRGNPPYSDNTPVIVPSTIESQRTYTLKVTTNDGQHRETDVTLTQHAPTITAFSPDPPPQGPVGATEQINLNWKTLYAIRAYLRTPRGGQDQRVHPHPSAPRPVQPGFDALAAAADWQLIPKKVAYTLLATGYDKPVSRDIHIELDTVKILWLKFGHKDADGNLSGIKFRMDPPDWHAVELTSSDPRLTTLVLHQPGGTKIDMWLGAGDTEHPQVQYFEADRKDDDQWTLTWVTANLASLVLNPGGYKVPEDQITEGSYDITPANKTEYVLEATGKNRETITSTLYVETEP